MAYAMMGGIILGTVLTLLFLPALYVAWFRIKEPVLPHPAVVERQAERHDAQPVASDKAAA